MPERGSESLPHVDPELPPEILPVDVPELHLQDELPDHALILSRRESAINRKVSLVDPVDVWIPIVFVLKMRTVDMRERSHAQPDHIGAGPQEVAIKEP